MPDTVESQVCVPFAVPILRQTSPLIEEEALQRFGALIASLLSMGLEFQTLSKAKKGLRTDLSLSIEKFWLESSGSFGTKTFYICTDFYHISDKEDAKKWKKALSDCEAEYRKFLDNIKEDLHQLRVDLEDEIKKAEEEAARKKELQENIAETLSELSPAAFAYLAGEGKKFLVEHVKAAAPKPEKPVVKKVPAQPRRR